MIVLYDIAFEKEGRLWVYVDKGVHTEIKYTLYCKRSEVNW